MRSRSHDLPRVAAAHDHPPAVRDRRQALLEDAAADVLEHHVHAATVGRLAHPRGEVLRGVVDRDVRPELGGRAASFSSLPALVMTRAPARLATWMPDEPTP